MQGDVNRLLTNLSQQVGELRGEVRQILKKLESMEKKYNGYTEKTIRVEEGLAELRKLLNDHLHEHERQEGWEMTLKIAIFGALSGAIASFFFSLLMMMVR